MKKIIGTFLTIGLLGVLIGGVLTIIGCRNDAAAMIVPGIIFLVPSIGVLLGTFMAFITGNSKDEYTKGQEDSFDESESKIQGSTGTEDNPRPLEIPEKSDALKGKEKYAVKVGQTVYHAERLGLGTVKAVRDEEVLIKFRNGTEYKFKLPDVFFEGVLIKVHAKSVPSEPATGGKKAPVKPVLPQKGAAVFHEYFGIGEIAEISGRHIAVRFSDKERKFIYPDAFQKGYLKLYDAEHDVPPAGGKEDPVKPAMPRKGTAVVHKDFGEGKISEISGNYISVLFSDKERKFVYPEAFQKGHLVLKGDKKNMQPADQEKTGTEFWNIFTEILEENGEPFQFRQINQEIGEATKEGGNKAVTIRLLPARGTIEIMAQKKYYKFEFKINSLDDFSRMAEDVVVKINDMLLPVQKESEQFDMAAGNSKGRVNNFIIRYDVSPQNEKGIREMNVYAGEKYLMVYDAGSNCVGVVFEHFENRPVAANGQAEICFFKQYYNNYGRWHRMFYSGYQSGERILYGDLAEEVAKEGEFRYAGYIRP